MKSKTRPSFWETYRKLDPDTGGTQENHPGPVENQNGNPDIGKT